MLNIGNLGRRDCFKKRTFISAFLQDSVSAKNVKKGKEMKQFSNCLLQKSLPKVDNNIQIVYCKKDDL